MKWGMLFIVFLIPALAFSAEYCTTMFDGKCKEVCAENEAPELGAFMDCTDKQECCVLKRLPDKNKPGATSVAPVPAQKDNTKNK